MKSIQELEEEHDNSRDLW